MKIGIDIRSTLKKKTGIGKYTLGMINAIAGVDKKNTYYLYSQKKVLDFKRRLPKLPGRNFSHCVDYFKKGPEAALPDVDVFWTSSYDLQKPKGARFIVTVHDVIMKAYPHGHSKRTIEEIDEKIRYILSEADILVTDSYNSKSDLMKFYKVHDSKIHVIYPGVDPMQRVNTKEDYILFVGTLEPRKNVGGLIKAFDLLKKESGISHRLYIVGMKGWMYEDIFRAYEKAEFKKDIIFKGYVEEKELERLYQRASVFAYPSFYEGFGFPIVEAFCAGTPVVTSKTSSCGEIAGDSALLVDPKDHGEIAASVKRLIDNQDLRQELINKGIERAKRFTNTESARQLVNLFTNL